MKVQPDNKWPHTTSKGHASLVDSSCCHGKCKQANEFQEHHHGQYMEKVLIHPGNDFLCELCVRTAADSETVLHCCIDQTHYVSVQSGPFSGIQ